MTWGGGEGTFLKKSFLLPSPHPSPHLPKTFVTGVRRGVVCRAGPDEETLMSAGGHGLSAGDCCAASFPPELLSCSRPTRRSFAGGAQGRALFSKSVVPRFILFIRRGSTNTGARARHRDFWEGVFSCGKTAFPFCYKENPVVVICQSVKHVLLVEGCGARRVSSFSGAFMIGFTRYARFSVVKTIVF